jgi:hypothetical protein
MAEHYIPVVSTSFYFVFRRPSYLIFCGFSHPLHANAEMVQGGHLRACHKLFGHSGRAPHDTSDLFMHICIHGTVDKPTAYTHYDFS